MTPAIQAAKRAGIHYSVHEYAHDATETAYGKEAVSRMGVAAERVFKTLVVTDDGGACYVAVVPALGHLDVKGMAKAVGAKKIAMAEGKAVERMTGYVLGGVSPLGQKKRLRTVIDASARDGQTVFVSAGRRGLEIELSPDDLAALTGATFAPLAR